MTVFQKRQKTRSFTFGRQPVPNQTGIDGLLLSLSEPMQEKNFKTKELEFWDKEKTRPKMMVALEFQTQWNEGPDDNGLPDDGRRMHFVTVDYKQGGELSAIQEAMDAAGVQDIAEGGRLAIWFIGYDPESANPDQPRRLFQARYAPPPSAGGAFQSQGQQPQTQQAPPQQPQTQQTPPQQQFQQPQTQQAPPQQQFQQPPQPQAQQFQQPQPQAQQQQGYAPAPQQGHVEFTTHGPVDTGTGEIGGASFPAPQPQEVQVNVQDIQQRIRNGQPDGQIMTETGASMEAINALRNIG